jgi:Tol biopolymer transport system component
MIKLSSEISHLPIWTPDGRFVIFQKAGEAGEAMFWRPSDGSGQPQPLIEAKSKSILVPWSMSPDWKLAFFQVGKPGIYTVQVTEEGANLRAGKEERFFESTDNDTDPEFSPDGRWIAYISSGSNQSAEVKVRAFPAPASGQGGIWHVSTNGGTAVRWSGKSELLYQEGDRIMAVGYTGNGGVFVFGQPHVRIEKLGGRIWDVAPDGRIAIVTPVESSQAPATDHTVVFLENFFDYLRQRVPVGK